MRYFWYTDCRAKFGRTIFKKGGYKRKSCGAYTMFNLKIFSLFWEIFGNSLVVLSFRNQKFLLIFLDAFN